MKGGKLIGTGSSSCVFLPNIPCKTNGNISQNRVTKLLYHYDSKELSKYEKNQSDTIKKINGYKDWAIISNIINPNNTNLLKNLYKSYSNFTPSKIEWIIKKIAERIPNTLNLLFKSSKFW